MFPRRTAVLRVVIVCGVVFTSLSMWISSKNSSDLEYRMRHLMQNEQSNGISQLKSLTNNTSDQADHRQVILIPPTSSRSFQPTPDSNAKHRHMETFQNFYGSLSMKDLVAFKKEFSRTERYNNSNNHDFEYIIVNKNLCSSQSPFVIVWIHTSPDHFKQRLMIRQTWGNPRNHPDGSVKIIFIMGKASSKTLQDSLHMESERYGDIVQENFVDSYKNLTYKAIAGMKWVSSYCSGAKYALKSDDDIFVNVFNLVRHLKSFEKHKVTEKVLLCNVWHKMRVLRDKKSKWYIAEEEFKDDFFPMYCSGSAYIMSGDVVKGMFQVSLSTPFFWVDDFYVTGLLAHRLDLKHQSFNSVYHFKAGAVEAFTEGRKRELLVFAHLHGLNHFYNMWNGVVRREAERSPHLLSLTTRHST
ncbi:beta-1,3-galactosyltransferase 1 [Lingula anatina]|uniref:Hexosyltransferase n=1 Tax=Lingula anatina TaxID=7574 RepID=A0A1S3H1H8_LINAN|nr:beta-1,3-galactosyltransferase 1 [Lingula anatina]XP_013379990.1 beta-1,3-galactosyltransferase 1 [Lingula anatina]|eukprot:XP_013379989.1 beta-1,3-galactosyltransferase 1 [Lingula anatina]